MSFTKDPLEALTLLTTAAQSQRKEGTKTEWLEVALDCRKKKQKKQSLQEAGTRVPDRQSPRRGKRDRDDVVSQRGKSRDDSNEGAKRKRESEKERDVVM